MNREEVRRERKTRKDKKRDIAPTVSIELRDTIYRLSFITNKSVKSVAEEICINGVRQKKVITYLSQNFRRDIRIGNTLYFGDINRLSINRRMSTGKTARISIRFKSNTYEAIHALSYALDCTVSRACSLLLDASVRDSDFINDFVKRYLEDNIDAERMKELKKILKYINADNPYGEEYSWAALLSYMIDEVKETAGKVSDTVSEFIVKHWRD